MSFFIELNGEIYTYLGQGSFNKVFINSARTQVIKVPKLPEDTDEVLSKIDAPKRVLMLWQEINPQLEAKALEVCISKDLEDGSPILTRPPCNAWSCPFIEGIEPSDEEIAEKIIDIYNDTARVILDGAAPKNFIKTQNNDVVCIDIGLALNFAIKQESNKQPSLDCEIYNVLKTEYKKDLFGAHAGKHPKTVQTIKALLHLQEYRPDVVKVKSIFNRQPELITELAKAYDENSQNRFESDIPANLKELKNSLKIYCLRYIKSRGELTDKEAFNPSRRTKYLLDVFKTTAKVEAIKSLISSIDKAKSIDDITSAVNNSCQNQPSLIEAGWVFGGVRSCLANCQKAIKTYEASKLQSAYKPQP